MTTYIPLLLLTFLIMLCAAGIINFAKKRQRTGKHKLTGMCHKSGGTTCSSCSSAHEKKDKIESGKCTPPKKSP